MTYRTKAVITLMLFGGLAACAGAPKEQFDESFFTYKDQQGKKYFSFILKLKGMSNLNDRVVYERVAGRRTGKGPVGSKRSVNQEIPLPENPEDAKVSIKFRMEEMAHKKLSTKLEAIDYCEDGVEYELEEYKSYQYKIKGFCTSHQGS